MEVRCIRSICTNVTELLDDDVNLDVGIHLNLRSIDKVSSASEVVSCAIAKSGGKISGCVI